MSKRAEGLQELTGAKRDRISRRAWRGTISAALLLASLLAGGLAQAQGATVATPIRVSVTPSDVEGRGATLKLWGAYLEKRLGRPVLFFQRSSRMGVELLHQQSVDYAWIASHHYVRFPNWARLMAVPVVKDGWRTYLLAPAGDTSVRTLDDLRGRIFVYPDPAAYLNIQFELLGQHQMAESFFARSFTTNSEHGAVEAVAVGLAQAGLVDGRTWEALRVSEPAMVARTRVVQVYRDLAPAPIAARTSISDAEFTAMQNALIGMARDPEGERLLRELNLDGFAPARPDQFAGVARMVQSVNGPDKHAESSRP